MIETEHTTQVNANIELVWQYVKDIRQWAVLFPGCRECEVIDENNSRWVIKVGAGGLVRTVNVRVHIDEWNGPEQVRFSYKLEGDPVEGSGSYTAVRAGGGETDITLKVQVAGSGSMAPMWEAMSRPLLPQLARTFAERLKAEIEAIAEAEPEALPSETVSAPASPQASWWARCLCWLRRGRGSAGCSPTERSPTDRNPTESTIGREQR